jgi:hypothetical protein
LVSAPTLAYTEMPEAETTAGPAAFPLLASVLIE